MMIRTQAAPKSTQTNIRLTKPTIPRYHYKLKKKPPEETWKGSQAEIRSKWAKHVFDNKEWLYAIQTLRNAITSNTFYASTVLSLFALGAGRAFQAVQTMRTIHDPKSHFMRGSFESLQGYRVAALLLLLLGSAYKFAQAARTMTHAGFMFPTAPLPLLQKMMRKSENSQWGGLRYLYLSMGGVVWVIWGGESARSTFTGHRRSTHAGDTSMRSVAHTNY